MIKTMIHTYLLSRLEALLEDRDKRVKEKRAKYVSSICSLFSPDLLSSRSIESSQEYVITGRISLLSDERIVLVPPFEIPVRSMLDNGEDER